jgi:hypothetical protein
VKICAPVAFTKEYGSKTEVPKGPGLRLRSFMAFGRTAKTAQCPDPDYIFISKKQYVSSSRLQKTPQGLQIVRKKRKNVIKCGRK